MHCASGLTDSVLCHKWKRTSWLCVQMIMHAWESVLCSLCVLCTCSQVIHGLLRQSCNLVGWCRNRLRTCLKNRVFTPASCTAFDFISQKMYSWFKKQQILFLRACCHVQFLCSTGLNLWILTNEPIKFQTSITKAGTQQTHFLNLVASMWFILLFSSSWCLSVAVWEEKILDFYHVWRRKNTHFYFVKFLVGKI